MGVDEILLRSAAEGGAASLRLYAWDGPWLSLGYSQRLAGPLEAKCAAAGVGVVRRVTGGGAVLHGADLTYAVCAPDSLLPGGLPESYDRIASGLEAALLGLGVAVERGGAGGASDRPFDCFQQPASHELCAAGAKLVGSAQRRSRGGVLQHGSIRLRPDAPAAREATGLGTGATSLAELGIAVPLNELQARLVASLGTALEARFEPGGLRPVESFRAFHRGAAPDLEPRPETPGEPQGASSHADTY